MSAVVISASNLMPALRERLADEGDLVTFTDTEPIQALQAILETRPELIVLERLFAATPRGAALINRIKTDPQLARAEVRVMSHTGDYMRQVARPAAQVALSGAILDAQVVSGSSSHPAPAQGRTASDDVDMHRPLDWHGTRRALRHRVQKGAEIQLDGNPAAVVDVSSYGAQVISTTILRPNQKVRVGIPDSETLVRCRGTIAWAKFELPNPAAPPVYRAGVEFLDADVATVNRFATRNRS